MITDKNREHLSACAAAGASKLDEVRPNWFREIDIGHLDIRAQCHCVLGQLCGSFDAGWHNLGLNRRMAVDLGFYIASDRCASLDRPEKFAVLRAAWITEIDKRLTNEKVAQ